LDEYAIPTAEAFLPWIENALETSTGCAIFLGENGWGPTHFWEAERALNRYQKGAGFRLIPVALPGIREEDMRRLGSGTLFREINWADFRNSPVDATAIAKLRAALLGLPLPTGKGPSELTPYQIRRDAERWRNSSHRDTSVLYRGRQLAQAETLRAEQPDLVAGEAIVAFLSASARAQVRRARIVTGLAVFALVVISLLTVQRETSRRLALSRFVASEARQSPGPDTSLLLALQATRISDTPEASGALIERLDALPYLRQAARLGDVAIRSLAFDPTGRTLYAGTGDGHLWRTDLETFQTVALAFNAGTLVTALEVGERGELWVGTMDGRLVVVDAAGRGQVVDGLTGKGALRVPILCVEFDRFGRRVAVGDHQHRLTLFDPRNSSCPIVFSLTR
jgi:hypothetical protein